MSVHDSFEWAHVKFWGFMSVVGCLTIGVANAGSVQQVVQNAPEAIAQVAQDVKEAGRSTAIALGLIKEFEGLDLSAYLDPAGIPTIGYGTTIYPDGRPVKLGDTIAQQQAEEYLQHDMKVFEQAVTSNVQIPLTDAEKAALTSFTYNVGVGGLKQSTALRRLNAGDRQGAAEALTWWNKAQVNGQMQTLPGLERRRQEERKLFLSGAPR